MIQWTRADGNVLECGLKRSQKQAYIYTSTTHPKRARADMAIASARTWSDESTSSRGVDHGVCAIKSRYSIATVFFSTFSLTCSRGGSCGIRRTFLTRVEVSLTLATVVASGSAFSRKNVWKFRENRVNNGVWIFFWFDWSISSGSKIV